jgi:hypothetical protein
MNAHAVSFPNMPEASGSLAQDLMTCSRAVPTQKSHPKKALTEGGTYSRMPMTHSVPLMFLPFPNAVAAGF